CPAPDKPALLIVEVCKFHLQAAFRSRGTLAEYFQNETRPVDHLAFEAIFQITLLNGGKRTINDEKFGIFLRAGGRNSFDLAFAEKCGGPNVPDRQHEAFRHHYSNCESQSARFLQTRLGVVRPS